MEKRTLHFYKHSLKEGNNENNSNNNRSNNSKKDAILDHFRDLIQKFIDKGLLEFRYVHDLIWEYTQIISGVNLSNANANASSSDGEENVYDSKRYRVA